MNKQIFVDTQEIDLFSALTEAEKIESKLKADLSMLVVHARCNLGMNQAQFAKHLAVSQATISKWESGNCNLTIKSLSEMLAKIRVTESSDFGQILHLASPYKQNKNAWTTVGFSPSQWLPQLSSSENSYTMRQRIF